MTSYNPFGFRETRSARELATYRVLSLASWAVAVAVSVYYAVRAPAHGRRIGGQNGHHATGFSLSMPIVYVYWGLLFAAQTAYVQRLYAATGETAAAAAAVGAHFIVHNLLHAVFVLLFVAGHFVLAEVVLAANFVNLTALSMRHPSASHPLARIHGPVVAGPLAWTFVALFWNGAMAMPHGHSLVARVLANIFVWSFLGYGLLFILLGDVSMGLCLSVLSAALGVGQFFTQIIAFQWIFAFTVMSLLFVGTVAIAVPQWTSRDRSVLAVVVSDDAEQAPLLHE